jgi:hypothetical protein
MIVKSTGDVFPPLVSHILYCNNLPDENAVDPWNRFLVALLTVFLVIDETSTYPIIPLVGNVTGLLGGLIKNPETNPSGVPASKTGKTETISNLLTLPTWLSDDTN